MVIAVGDVNLVIRSDGDTAGKPEFARTIAALADVQQELSGHIKNLQVVKQSIGYINVTECVRSDSLGPPEMSGGIAVAAKSRDKFPAEIKHLHAAVHGIGHEDVPLAVGGYMRGKIE